MTYKTDVPLVCGRCGKILNEATPYSVYFHADTSIMVCKKCWEKEQEEMQSIMTTTAISTTVTMGM